MHMIKDSQNSMMGEISVTFSEDNLTAYLCLAPEDPAKEYELKQLHQILEDAGVRFGIQEDVLQEMIRQKKYNTFLPVATGTPAQNGKDGWFEFLFPTDISTKPKVLEDGSVDYMSCGQYPSVEEGQEIVRYHKATEPVDGMNVLGELILAQKGRELARLRGKGFIVSEDMTSYTARVTGKATYQNDILNVDQELTIKGDVSYTTTGNVHFVGDIRIMGNVLSGMSVTSDKGGIIVDGYVEAAGLKAAKDIVLKNGMQGNGQGSVATGGAVSGKFFERTRIEAGMDVSANAIMGCDIHAGQDITVSGKYGAIIGGSVFAMRSIESRIIGNMAEVRTQIEAGQKNNLLAQLTRLEQMQNEQQAEIEKILPVIKKINEILETAPQEDLQKKKMQLMRAKIEIDSKINELIKQKQDVLEKMSMANEAKVSVLKMVYPGTIITINGVKVAVKEAVSCVEYTRRGSGIIAQSMMD